MRRSVVLLAIGALTLGACSTAAGSGSFSGAVVDDGGISAAVGGAAQASASPVVSVAPESAAPAASGAPAPNPSALVPGFTLTVEPSDGSVFGLPPTVPSGTNLMLFNAGDVPFQMTVLEKASGVTDSWDVILACGVTSDVATVTGSVVAQPGANSDSTITVQNQGDDLLVLVPLAAEPTAAPTEAPTAAPSAAATEAPTAAPSVAASEAAGSPAPTVAPEPTATPAPTCPPGGIAGGSPAASVAPSIAAPSAAASLAHPSAKPHKTPKPHKSPKPTPSPAATPIPGIPDLTNAAWQVFTVTPPGTLPGQTAAP
jgi:hypothetical protein